MLWILPAAGLLILLLWIVRRPRPIQTERHAPLEDGLASYLQTLAARPMGRKPARLQEAPNHQQALNRALRMIRALPQEQLLPASRWLNDHGRMLQEEAATLHQALRKTQSLPATEDGEPRIACFARVFWGHTNAELTRERLDRAVGAWQSQTPFSVQELALLPLAMKQGLMALLTGLAQQCEGEQRLCQAADKTLSALKNEQSKKAQKQFGQHRHNSLYLHRLLTQLRKASTEEAAQWSQWLSLGHERTEEELTNEDRVHQSETVRWVSNGIASLRLLDRLPWDRLLEEWSLCHQAFSEDEVYRAMDAESRSHYRFRVGEISRMVQLPERAVCEAVLTLCAAHSDVRSHCGYYLMDEGVSALLKALHQPETLRFRLRFGRRLAPLWRGWLVLVFVLWLAIGLLLGAHPLSWVPVSLLMTVGLSQIAKRIIARITLPHLVPRIQLETLPDQARTLVVCPTMLLSPSHALQTVRQLSILQKANPDANLHFLLLGDFRDSIAGSLTDDEEIVSTAAAAIRALRESTGHPFFYFQRERIYHLPDHVHMSRERKRGGLETVMKLMEGLPIEDTFAYATMQPEKLAGQYRYLITLDNDTLMPPGAALRLVGAMLHPLQQRRAIGDGVRGISILQPAMKVAVHKAQTPFARLMERSGGLDPYNGLQSDFDQDVLGNGAFQGKGIIDPKPFLRATEGQMIPGAVLSHDLLEGLLAGCARATDIVLYEGQPETLKGYLGRLHRWTRGDWQLLPYLVSFLPHGPERNALLRSDRRIIRRTLLGSLLRPLQWLTIILCVLLHQPWALVLALLSLDFPLLGSGRWGLLSFLVRLAMLPPQSCMQLDAIGRTLYRVLFSRQKLLQWTTATELTIKVPRPDMRFFYMSMAAAGGLALLCILPGALRLAGIPLAAYWAAFPFLLPRLEKQVNPSFRPTGYMREVLLRLGKNTLLFFETAITGEDHGLPPDNVQIDPNKGISHRTSPTNIGLYLCALIAAQRLELLSASEVAQRIRPAVEAMEQMEKWQGHLMNWYDTRTLEPLRPRFVSTVDSGNLAVCLVTAAQGLRSLMHLLPEYDEDLPPRLDALAAGMRFSPLYDSEAELFRIGMDLEREEVTPAHYDLLASESRLTSFYAIMTGQVPVRHWFRLGRTRVHTRHGQTLLSSNGTLFEYLMPFLFHPAAEGSLLTETARSAIQLQYQHRMQGVSGVSESGYYAFDPNLYYQYKAFGLPKLALNPHVGDDVVAPYATLLALPLVPKDAFANLLHLQSLGMEGPMGLFEAADFNPERIGDGQPMRLVHSHMAHHQGMILCAISNFLCENALANLFFHLPVVQAYRLLLEEPMVRLPGVVRMPLSRLSPSQQAPSPFAAVPVPSLCFPIHAHVLHGGGTTLLVDAQGGGYLSHNGLMMTRFSERCHLPSGLRLYLRDSQSGQYWQATEPGAEVVFETAQAVFTLKRNDILSTLRMFVDPLTGAAVYALTVENQSQGQRMLEVCSYLEPSLFAQRDMEAHPSYRKLFLETEKLGSYGAGVRRRPASPDEQEQRLWHVLATDTALSVFHIQTDRCAFLGRGRSLYAPRELEMPLSGLADATGAMVDPCLSLRGQFVLQPGSSARFLFVTHLPKADEAPSAFLLRCDTPESVLRWYDTALTQALVTAQSLDLSPEEQALLAPVCGLISYTGQPSQTRYADGNDQPLRSLWPLGISGDLPLMVLECHDRQSLQDAALLLKLHAFCRLSGLWFDLVLLCSPETEGELANELQNLARRSYSGGLLGQNGGVFVLADGEPEQRQVLMAAARLCLRSAEGSVQEQLQALLTPAQGRALYRQKAVKAWKITLPDPGNLLYANGYGGFSPEDGNYIITLPPGRQTPAPWCNPLCNPHFGTLAGESGLLFSYADNSNTGRLTRWPCDSVHPVGEENFFLRDDAHHLLWSLTRQPLGMGLAVRITHAPGETIYESSGYGITSRMHCFTDQEARLGLRVIHLKNEDSSERILTFCHTLLLTVDDNPATDQLCHASRLGGGLCLENPQMGGVCGLCAIDPEAAILTTMSPGAFQGLWGIAPAALSGAELPLSGGGNAAMLCLTVQLKPGESKTLTCALAQAPKRSDLLRIFQHLRRDGATLRLHRVKQAWEQRLTALRYYLPDAGLSLMLNRWLPYQVRSARLMMRGAFYQAGGAIGFRDQLQDMLSLLLTEPAAVREHLLLCAAHQFEAGDVQHWWHPEGPGVRTRISDDLLFLPYVTAHYVQVTGDQAILEEPVPWLVGAELREDERERLFTPEVSQHTSPLREHCLRAIQRVAYGPHELPQMGSGDWNDGLNHMGGESVWLGMFLCEVLRQFAPLCPAEIRLRLQEKRRELLVVLDQYAWDGGWYLRGWYENGKPLGSRSDDEGRIDVLPQSWAVLCGVSRDRCQSAMENVWRMLYQPEIGILKLFAPPFDSKAMPGYLAGYLPGIRENGGQYTHAVPWAIAALHQLGQDDRAWELALALLPPRHSETLQLARRYRVEPYVLAGDIYAHPQQRGRGGWTWYTGSAAWYQVVITQQLLGFQKTGDSLRFRPVLPPGWDEVHLSYRYGSATYHLHANRDCTQPVHDGQPLTGGLLRLVDDGRIHEATFPVR